MARPIRKMTPVALKNVAVEDAFWTPRLETNRKATLPIEYRQCKDTGRIDAWKLDWKPGKGNPPHIFWDSDIGKWLEAVAYSLATHPDKRLETLADGVIHLIEKAQQKDGYLNIYFTAVEPKKRWSNLRDCHELYCAGHLMEAAVAYYQATGKRALLDVLCRYADYIAKVFGPKKGQKRGYPGHEEIELALVKLHRTTGNGRYLELAKFFVDERGRAPHYYDIEAKARGEEPAAYWAKAYDYNQAHAPVREQTTAEGHAVRACYLYAGMADVAAETGDRGLLAACRAIWRNIVERRMYVTGAIGSAHGGERFTFDYDLPDETAYAETCANIALVFFAHRMLQVEADGRYGDVMERALYNGVISGISLDGTRFFYVNPLSQHPRAFQYNHWVTERQQWFGCACCPPNIARLLASFGEYVYSQSRNGVWVHLYAGGRATVRVGGQDVELVQKTEYPWKETVRITVRPEKPASFALSLRIPSWCRKPALKVNGKAVKIAAQKGYARIARTWKRGDRVELRLPMPVERVEAHPAVRHCAGRVALQRGPVVYCLEEVDNGPDLHAAVLPKRSALKVSFKPRLLGGVSVITAKALRPDPKTWKSDLYHATPSTMKPFTLTAVPYCVWANRKTGEMRVWLRDG